MPVPIPRTAPGAKAIFSIMQDALPGNWDLPSVERQLQLPHCFGFFDRDAGPNGFILMQSAADQAELLSIAIRRKYQRAGLGRALLHQAISACQEKGARSIFLEVAEDNQTAWQFYKKYGFIDYDRRPGYYLRDGGRVDAVLMRRDA